MGSVYRAVEIELEREVAIKLLHPELSDDTSRRRFTREGRILSALSHPHVLQFYRFGMWNSRCPYIAMEYFQGLSLSVLMRNETLSVGRCLAIFDQVCEAMEYAHSHNVIHRDLSPGNIMVQAENDDFAKVIDFGLSICQTSQRVSQHLTNRLILGSVYYMSPEQCSAKRADARSDVYSLGCVLYHTLASAPPFEADNPIGLMHKHNSEMPPPLLHQKLPAGLENVLLRALSKDPASRHQSMAELRRDLKLVADGEGDTIAPPATLSAGFSQKKRFLPTALILATLPIGAASFLALDAGMKSRRFFDTDSHPAKISDPDFSLRKLRTQEELLTRTPEERIDYYNSWLAAHGAIESLDTIEAHLQLAQLPGAIGALEGPRQRRLALGLSKGLLDRSLTAGDADLVDDVITKIIKLRENEKGFLIIQETEGILKRLEARGNFYLKAMNVCRRTLGEQYCLSANYRRALPYFDQLVDSLSLCSIPPASRLGDMIQRARCLHNLAKNEEARLQLTEACAFASEIPRELDCLLDLIRECLAQKQYNHCAEICTSMENNLADSNLELLTELREAEVRCFTELHRSKELFDVLMRIYKSSSESAVRFKYWRDMSVVNLNYKLHSEDVLRELLQSQIDSLAAKPAVQDVAMILHVLRQGVELHIERGDLAGGRTLMRCLPSIPTKWEKEPLAILLPSFMDCTRQLRSVGQTRESEQLVQLLSSQCPDNSGLQMSLCFERATNQCIAGNHAGGFSTLNSFLHKMEKEGKIDEQISTLLLEERMVGRIAGRHEEGRAWTTRALNLAEENHRPRLRIEAMIDIGIFDFLDQDYVGAERKLREAVSQSVSYPNGLLRGERWLSQTYLKLKNYPLAEREAEKVLTLYKTPVYYRIAVRQYMDICLATGNKQKYATLSGEYDSLLKSIN